MLSDILSIRIILVYTRQGAHEYLRLYGDTTSVLLVWHSKTTIFRLCHDTEYCCFHRKTCEDHAVSFIGCERRKNLIWVPLAIAILP